MAGKYSRFRLFGNKVPKYLLPLGAETVLFTILANYVKWVSPSNIYLIANRNDQIFFPIVRSTLNKFTIPWSNLIYIDDTSSQLETATATTEILSNASYDEPIAFANIDTVLKSREEFFDKLSCLESCMGCIDTFKGSSNQYSYANVIDQNMVVDVVDQKIISEYACSGLYGFGSYKHMSSITDTLLQNFGSANFTNLYQEYLKYNYQVVATYSPSADKTIVLGTPEEYVINIHRFS